MAEWIAFLLVVGIAGMFTAAATLALLVGRAFSHDWSWLFPPIVFGLLAWVMWSCAVDLAPFTIQEVPRG